MGGFVVGFKEFLGNVEALNITERGGRVPLEADTGLCH